VADVMMSPIGASRGGIELFDMNYIAELRN
jgi:hypothetical protein